MLQKSRNHLKIQGTRRVRGGGEQLVEALRYKPEGAGSIPDGIIYIFHSFNPSGRNTAL